MTALAAVLWVASTTGLALWLTANTPWALALHALRHLGGAA